MAFAASLTTLSEYAALQSRLCALLWSGSEPADDMLGLPKSGIIVLEEQSWTFRRHGAGVGFKRNRDGIEIEAHVRPFSLSRGIDAWRLLLFLESSGAKRLIADDQAFDVTSLEAVQTMLESLANSGTLEVADDAKRIYLLRT